jgi:hypothetical protein
MENVQVLLEIISELRAENKVKVSDKEKEASHFGTRLISELDKERKEVEPSLTTKKP